MADKAFNLASNIGQRLCAPEFLDYRREVDGLPTATGKTISFKQATGLVEEGYGNLVEWWRLAH